MAGLGAGWGILGSQGQASQTLRGIPDDKGLHVICF